MNAAISSIAMALVDKSLSIFSREILLLKASWR
jgi:hypothetical protein